MEEEKLMEDEVKKQKERNNEVGGQNFTPPHSFPTRRSSDLYGRTVFEMCDFHLLTLDLNFVKKKFN